MTKKNSFIETIGIFLIILNIYFSYVKYFGFSLFVPAALGCILLLISKWKNFKIYKGSLKFLIILFIILVSCLFHFNTYSFSFLIKFCGGVLVLLIFENCTNIETRKISKYFKRMSLLFAGITIISCFAQSIYFSLVKLLYEEETATIIMNLYQYKGYSGIAGQTGNNAFLILIGGIVVIYELLFEKNNKLVSTSNLLIVIIAILLTDKRMFLLMLIIVLMFYTYLYLNNKKLTKRKMTIIMIGLVLFCGFSYYAINHFKVFSRFSNIEKIMNGRDLLALSAIQLIKDNYLFGVGINNYIVASGQTMYAHNVFLQLVSELGVLFATITLFIIISSLFKKIKILLKQVKEKVEVVSTFSTFVQIVFVLYFFTGNSFYDANMLYIYFISQAIFDVYLRGEKSEKNRNSYIS